MTDALITSELSDFCFFTNSLKDSTVVEISFGNLFCFGGSLLASAVEVFETPIPLVFGATPPKPKLGAAEMEGCVPVTLVVPNFAPSKLVVVVAVLVEPNTPNPVLCVDAAVPKPKLPRPPRPVLADVAGVPKLSPVPLVAALEPAPKLRPPVPNPVLPNAGVVVPNVGAALAPNAGVVVAPKLGGAVDPKAGVVVPKAGAAEVAPNAGVPVPKAGAAAPKAGVAVAPNAGVEEAPKAGAVDVAPKAGVALPNAGASVAGVLPKRPDGCEVAVKPKPGVAGLLAPKLKPPDNPVVAGALDGVPKEKDILTFDSIKYLSFVSKI